MDYPRTGFRYTTVTIAFAIATTLHPVLSAHDRKPQTVRAADNQIEALIAEGRRRSPAFRSLIEQLEQSTVLIYVNYRMLPAGLIGRLTLLTSSEPWRYVRIEIECRQSDNAQIAALGHELQHAVEISEASDVDRQSMAALYSRIGFSVDGGRRRFETEAARAVGARIRHELASPETSLALR
jgi:hypothetical protein